MIKVDGINRKVDDNKLMDYAKGYLRYETLRRLNPRQFTDLYMENIRTGVPFDTLVDNLTSEDKLSVFEFVLEPALQRDR